MLSQPIIQDIDVYKGRDFKKTYELRDGASTLLNLTGWTFKSQIRPTNGSDVLIAELDISVSTSLSTVTISLTDTVTASISSINPIRIGSTTTSSNMVWDLSVTNNASERYVLLAGKCIFHETATLYS